MALMQLVDGPAAATAGEAPEAKKKGAARKKKGEGTASDAEGAPKRTRKQKAAAA
jgi:hypothetical protein